MGNRFKRIVVRVGISPTALVCYHRVCDFAIDRTALLNVLSDRNCAFVPCPCFSMATRETQTACIGKYIFKKKSSQMNQSSAMELDRVR